MARAGSEAPVVRGYRALRVRRARWRRRSDALFSGAFLGLLDHDQLAAIDREYYESARETVRGTAHRYVDEIHIRSGLAEWERLAVTDHFPPGARVVVTGAGAGREVLGLLECGFDPVGYEPNETLVEAGGSVLGAGRLHVCARDEFPAAAAPCDAILIGWGSYALIAGRERRVRMLSGARRRLGPGAPLMVSFFVRHDDSYFRTVHAVASSLRRLRRAEPVEFGDILTPQFAHYFSREEVASELTAAGFDCVHFAARPYGHAVARAR